MKKTMIITLAALTFAGCETTSSRPYTKSTENVIAIQQAMPTDKKVSIGEFTAAEGVDVDLNCRALGAIEVAPGESAVKFIRDAYQEEIFDAGVYDPAAPKIRGTVTNFEANSWGTGKWDISLNLSSDANPEGIDVVTAYSFKTSFSAIKACQNVVDAFTPAVQNLIANTIDHPEFGTLIR